MSLWDRRTPPSPTSLPVSVSRPSTVGPWKDLLRYVRRRTSPLSLQSPSYFLSGPLLSSYGVRDPSLPRAYVPYVRPVRNPLPTSTPTLHRSGGTGRRETTVRLLDVEPKDLALPANPQTQPLRCSTLGVKSSSVDYTPPLVASTSVESIVRNLSLV